MKTKMLLPTLILAVMLVSCKEDRNPLSIEADNATGDYKTVYLFEIEGVKVYRFWDKGHYHYIAIGRGAKPVQSSLSETRNTGKISQTEYWDDSTLAAEQ